MHNLIDDYVEQHSTPQSPVLDQITHLTALNVLNAHQLSGPIQGRLLSFLSRMIEPDYILEIGTFTGYSAICLAEGVRQKVITLEHNDELEDRIRQHLALTPLGKKIDLLIGDAKKIIPALNHSFPLVFIDADKREYEIYLELVYPLVPAGGWILADNTLWGGHVIDPAYDKDSQTLALRLFNDKVVKDSRFETLLLPIRDGLTILRKC